MLRCALALALLPSLAAAEGLRRPEKLTVALSDELLGQLSPDGKRLYFLSNRNATSQVFTHDLDRPSATLLFDEGADVSWPRLAPDGKRLLYVSYRDDATGRLCIREFPKMERTCLDESGALAAAWMAPDRLILIARPSVEGDLRIEQVRTGVKLRSTPFLQRNLAGPAVSPDGKWLAFVPVERTTERLGPAFAGQAARHLVFRRLDGDREIEVRLALPGVTGQPAFSADGRWLYVTQYLNDTDQNSVVDADDHGVIFRVPFSDPAQLASAIPEQLTAASWNCQYPAPSASKLILTCSRGGSRAGREAESEASGRGDEIDGALDVYALPLDGIVPETWSAARIRDEMDAARDPWQRLLLTHRLARAERDPEARARLDEEVLRLHLELGEYQAADELAHALGAPLGPILEIVVEHRRALRAFDRGELGQQFLDDTRARLQRLEGAEEGPLRHLALSELYDDVGEKQAAVRELERARLDAKAPPLVVALAAARAETLHRELDQPDALLAALAPLAEHPSLTETARLRVAGLAARAVARGLPLEQADAALAKARARFAADSPLAFRIDLLRCLPRVDPATLEAGRKCIGELYAAHASIARRRVLVGEVLQHAEVSNADDLEYELVRRWVRDVPRDSAERAHAERRFRLVVEDYAYASLAKGRTGDAAREFASVIAESSSYESEVGLLETDASAAPASAFTRAYLAWRELTELDGPAFDKRYADALFELKRAEETRGEDQLPEVQALHGALLHLRFLRAGDRLAAEEAGYRYQLALDLSHDNPRYRAMLVEQLGLLHSAVGNHRLAIGWFDAREKLPFADPLVALGHHLTRARSLMHVGREADAPQAAGEAQALIARTPSLQRFAPLALDRAALYALAAGDAAHALALYDRLRDGDALRLPLARAAAALAAGQPARALADLARVERVLANPKAQLAFTGLGTDEARVTFSLLALGLRAQAERALGKTAEALKSLTARHALLAARSQKRDLDDDLLALSLAEAQLADLSEKHDLGAAVRYTAAALTHADAWAKRTATPLADAQLAVLSLAAELALRSGAPRDRFGFDLAVRLRAAYDGLASARDPARHVIKRRFGVYLTLLAL